MQCRTPKNIILIVNIDATAADGNISSINKQAVHLGATVFELSEQGREPPVQGTFQGEKRNGEKMIPETSNYTVREAREGVLFFLIPVWHPLYRMCFKYIRFSLEIMHDFYANRFVCIT